MLTKEEQMYLIINARNKCESSIKSRHKTAGEKLHSSSRSDSQTSVKNFSRGSLTFGINSSGDSLTFGINSSGDSLTFVNDSTSNSVHVSSVLCSDSL